ncbi:MAG: hypothetical protein KKF62_16160 [Bacteroidetes bacterium]|nr:hypothetical protein [Bacteroidota bacterium]MBU1115725.1 hypothetical protein [Bacteroidota bacterium]MBU1800526.1 hypothetical protein [Bacteroidota bacterium]
MKYSLMLCLMLLLLNQTFGQSKIYWVDSGTGKLQRANTNGTSIEDLVTSLSDLNAVAVDNVNGKVYWGKGISPAKIGWSYLDGSSSNSNLISFVTASNVADIAVDIDNGKIYWTDNISDKIYRANLNGTTIEEVLTGLSDPAGCSIDLINNKIYWVERSGQKICRANMDGSNIETIINSGLSSPYGLDVDFINSKIYFSDFGSGKIQKANLDGTNVTDVLTGLGFDIDAISLDITNGVIYYATYNSTIKKVNTNGSGNSTVVSGLVSTTGVHFYSTEVLPVELSSFYGALEKDKVILNWQTATEINNYGFEIERTFANNNQFQNWKVIGFVQGHGNSNSINEYTFIDSELISGTLKYRLKQIDTDGVFEYSNIIEVFIDNLPLKYELTPNYPNPFNPTTLIAYQIPNNVFIKPKSVIRKLRINDKRPRHQFS